MPAYGRVPYVTSVSAREPAYARSPQPGDPHRDFAMPLSQRSRDGGAHIRLLRGNNGDDDADELLSAITAELFGDRGGN